VKLHEAIDEVLADHADAQTAREIADEIERRGLYFKPSDGQPAPARQITARVGNKTYRARYEKGADGRIRRAPSESDGAEGDFEGAPS